MCDFGFVCACGYNLFNNHITGSIFYEIIIFTIFVFLHIYPYLYIRLAAILHCIFVLCTIQFYQINESDYFYVRGFALIQSFGHMFIVQYPDIQFNDQFDKLHYFSFLFSYRLRGNTQSS